MKINLALIFVFFLDNYLDAVPFSITFWSNSNLTGPSYKLDGAHENLGCTSEAFGGIKSFCHVGAWYYITTDGVGSNYGASEGPDEECLANCTLGNIAKAYPLGPSDTSIPAITILDKTTGEIAIIEKFAEANVNTSSFRDSVHTTGWSNWTLFENKNFEGKSKCAVSALETDSWALSAFQLPSVGSVIRGCNFSKQYLNNMRKMALTS